MTARLDDRWQYNTIKAVVMDNPALQVVVLPETGARIHSILHKPTDTELLWRHPRNHPTRVPHSTRYDNVFSGGWDELMPGADECEYNGEKMPDHGELWAVPWDAYPVPMDDGSVCLYTGVSAAILPLRYERWLRLDAEKPVIHVRYRVSNLSHQPLNLIWGLHPLLNISGDHRLDLPASNMLVAMATQPDFGASGQEYTWPMLPTPDGERDMRQIPPPEANVYLGHYAIEPSENWFALTDTKRQVGIGMVYPTDIFKTLWIWQTYGGWRGLYHLAVEPWVGYPVRLDKAVEAGRHRVVMPGEPVEYELSVVVYTGVSQVQRITRQGDGVKVE